MARKQVFTKHRSLFDRNVPGTTAVLAKKTVAVAGCGGLGSTAAIALVRAGVGHLIIADFDRVEASNLNRQQYFTGDIGRKKTAALSAHLKKINPSLKIVCVDKMLGPKDIQKLFTKADLMIEAFDRAESKQWLIEAWTQAFPDRPVICGNGLAGIGNTETLRVVKFSDNVYFCGDGKSDMSIGLCSARVAIVANMQANTAISLLVQK
ncbi:MAG: thiamine biosynthesis protein ThiF [Bdellovibrionales bacterium RIFOXYD1_FULL_53_11]|nr:MAG: thiamine biosynthesis protein ThiF [Bdellovibrionales bacterium RIFOXYD1_FULL_53_11]